MFYILHDTYFHFGRRNMWLPGEPARHTGHNSHHNYSICWISYTVYLLTSCANIIIQKLFSRIFKMLKCKYGNCILQASAYCYITVIEASCNLGESSYVSLAMEHAVQLFNISRASWVINLKCVYTRSTIPTKCHTLLLGIYSCIICII